MRALAENYRHKLKYESLVTSQIEPLIGPEVADIESR